jgi:hypothetical protein
MSRCGGGVVALRGDDGCDGGAGALLRPSSGKRMPTAPVFKALLWLCALESGTNCLRGPALFAPSASSMRFWSTRFFQTHTPHRVGSSLEKQSWWQYVLHSAKLAHASVGTRKLVETLCGHIALPHLAFDRNFSWSVVSAAGRALDMVVAVLV